MITIIHMKSSFKIKEFYNKAQEFPSKRNLMKKLKTAFPRILLKILKIKYKL